MNRITKIETQKKNTDRVNIYMDDVYSFSCDREIILKFKLKEGLEISKENLAEIIELSHEKRAFQLALNYLSFKPRTQHEVSTYLLGKEYEDPIISKVLHKLSYYKYLDDLQYSANYISNAMIERRKSVHTVQSDLEKKGISQEIIQDTISMFSSQTNLEIAKEISHKYFQQKSDLPYKQLKNKLSQLLVRKGFSWDVVHQCLCDLDQSEEVQSVIDSNKLEYEAQAMILAKKYLLKYGKKEKNPHLVEMKVKNALYQKGFEMDTIHRIVKIVKNNS